MVNNNNNKNELFMAIDSEEKRSMLNEFMVKQNCRCIYCGTYCFIGTKQERIDKDKYDDIATIEHLLPLGHPDRNHKKNLAMCCNKCNNYRSNFKIFRKSKARRAKLP